MQHYYLFLSAFSFPLQEMRYFEIFFFNQMRGDLPSYPYFMVSAFTASLSESVAYAILVLQYLLTRFRTSAWSVLPVTCVSSRRTTVRQSWRCR